MAIWQKVFSRRNWQNRPSTATPLNETNLNVGDAALDEIDDRVIELNNRTLELEGYETVAAQSAAEAAQSESNAEAWAVGQRDGTDVSSDDPTYHNNSKYYSEVSEDYSDDAHGWADNQGDSGSNTYDSTHNAYYFMRKAQQITDGILRVLGKCLFANLPTIADSTLGDMWKITDAFTTTNDFDEGAGHAIPAGTYVYLTETASGNKWTIFSSASASDAIIKGTQAVIAQMILDGEIPNNSTVIITDDFDYSNDFEKSIFKGTKEEVEQAIEDDEIEEGQVVIITNDYE